MDQSSSSKSVKDALEGNGHHVRPSGAPLHPPPSFRALPPHPIWRICNLEAPVRARAVATGRRQPPLSVTNVRAYPKWACPSSASSPWSAARCPTVHASSRRGCRWGRRRGTEGARVGARGEEQLESLPFTPVQPVQEGQVRSPHQYAAFSPLHLYIYIHQIQE